MDLKAGDISKVHMGIDEAIVNVTSSVNVSIWAQSDACFKCPLVRLQTSGTEASFSTQFRQQISVIDDINKTLCRFDTKLMDQGFYELNVSDCSLTLSNRPADSNIPVYVAVGILISLFLLWNAAKLLLRSGLLSRVLSRFATQEQLINPDLDTPLITDGCETPSFQPTNRIKSVDTFRGLSLIIMIFVNYGGGSYWYFQHSSWNGITVADIVFPWFVFLMGTSIAISFRSALRRGTSRKALFLRVFRRSVILFMFGLALSNNGPSTSFSNLRIFGVLQRLAITYFVVASVETFCALPTDPHAHKRWRCVRELVPSWPTWLTASVLVVIHLCLTFLLDVPGCGRGYLGPGGLHDNGSYFNCTGGAAGYIDRVVLTYNHMYRGPTCRRIYQCPEPYDPEGILGTLTAVLLCVLGLQAGKILITYQSPLRMVRRWIIWGLCTGLLAGVLCKFRLEDGWIPVNKNLWSLSFVLALASMAFLILSLFYVAIDVYNLWNGAPFIYPGMNSIVVYLCSEVFEEYFPVYFHVTNSHTAQLALHIWGSTVWVIMASYLYYKNVFVAI